MSPYPRPRAPVDDDARVATRRRQVRRRCLAAVVGLLGVCGVVAVLGAQAGSGTHEPSGAPTTRATRLDPDLVDRFEQASRAAAEAGVRLTITSGWRSAAQQQQIVEEKVAELGVVAAHRVVAPVSRSAHVDGRAIDVGPHDGAAWLRANGWQFGLCPVYANEPWHFEPTADPGGTCPPLVPDVSGLWQ